MAYKFFVAGVKFYDLGICIGEVQVGDNLVIIAEPTNPYDSNAVRLEFASQKRNEQIMVGYVPKTFSASVSAALMVDDTLEAVVTKVDLSAKTHLQLEVEITSLNDREIRETEQNLEDFGGDHE